MAPVGETSQAARGGAYLTFRLAGEAYGVEIQNVREIIAMTDITPVPQMPPYVRGLINLRGRIIPVVDMRARLGMCTAEYGERTCIVVVEDRTHTGVVVDAVEDVVRFEPDEIDPPPRGASAEARFVGGIGRGREGVTILLAIEALLEADEPRDAAVGAAPS